MTTRLETTTRIVNSPVGPLVLTVSDTGLERVAFGSPAGLHPNEDVEATIGPGLNRARMLDEVVRQLDEYFAGRRRRFDVPLDVRPVHGFRRRALDTIGTIAYGATATYASVAVALGRPGAVRAVGAACATNPVPIVVPCHRVVRSDGRMGEFLGGREVKEALLALEAA